MERIVYNKTLDTHKSGVQFTLQGFETADKMSRRIVISLMASGDAIDLPLEQIEAVMYVTTPGIVETSINACTINGNTIIYDALPITEEGITIMQLKLIGTRPDGASCVLASPRFAVEVVKSDAEDESIEGTASYTAVEEALARARGVYESRLLRIALHTDCMFYAYYADGTIYESDVLKELFLKGDALLSESFAHGGTGVRDGEDTDNSMYYSNVAMSMALETKRAGENALEILDEVKKHGVYTIFSANFETGELFYESPKYAFEIDKESGELNIIGKAYNIEETMILVAKEWLQAQGVTFPEFKNAVDANTEDVKVLKETVEEHSNAVERLDSVVLWENPDTTADFPAQTIEVDCSEYKRFIIVFRLSTIGDGAYYELSATQKDVLYSHPSEKYYADGFYRNFTIHDNGVVFGESPSTSYPSIPCKIIGYKH